MTQRYRKFKRAWGMYYAFDTVTGNSVSLKTKDKAKANHLVVAMNEAGQQAAMNLSLAKVYLRHSDPLVASRTWQHVMDEIIRTKTGENQIRWQVVAKSKKYDFISFPNGNGPLSALRKSGPSRLRNISGSLPPR
jgi:hypothetical protein